MRAPLLPLLSCLLSAAVAGPGVTAIPLPERPPSGAATRFTTLPPAHTGITFVNHYADPAMWGDRYEEFAYGSLGTGIAIADFDGDGRPDIFVVGKSDPSRLYRNLGDFRFEDVTAQAGLVDPNDAWKHGAAFVDVNNDGHLDLYLCRHGAPNLLFLNQGDGTFVESAAAAGLAVADASVMAAFADFDRDGWLDVYVQTSLLDQQRSPRGQRDRLFRNRGDGTFEEVSRTAGLFGETQGHSATWWDFDRDGWPDLYVANDFLTPDQLYLNRRDGTFGNVLDAVVPYFPHFAMGADLADVNNDGWVDLFVADMLPTSRALDQRGMLNMRALMARELPPEAAAQYMRNMLYLNTGTGRMQEAAWLAGLAATDWTWSVRWEDLDEDGRVDLHVTNGMIRNFFDADLLARMAQVDLAQRRRLVRAAPELRERNLAFRNDGDLQFREVGAEWGLDHLGISFGVAFADLDGDGDLDLVFSNYQGGITVCRNDTTGTHRVLFDLRGSRSNRFGMGARLTIETRRGLQVREMSLARGYLSTSEPVAHFGLGDDEVIDRLTIEWPSGHRQILTGLAANHRYTILEPPGPPGAEAPAAESSPLFQEVGARLGLAISRMEQPVDELAAQRLLPVRQQPIGPSLAVGDADGDGEDDVVIGGLAGSPMQVLTAIGGRFFPAGNPVVAATAEVADGLPLLLDFDGDGLVDLFVPQGGVNRPAKDPAYAPRMLWGRGAAIFHEAEAGTLPPRVGPAKVAVAADFDRDGRLDVFLGGSALPGEYPRASGSALWRNLGGRFEDVTARVAPGLAEVGLVRSALWTDVDGDGWLDLLIAVEWGKVRCWRNDGGRRLVEVTDDLGFGSAGQGWWTSLAAADFNGDGRMDYAVGNLGLNTPYQASPEHPLELFEIALDGSRPQLVESEWSDGRRYPRRGRNQLIGALPSLARRYPTFATYAEATLEDVIGADRLAAAPRSWAEELRSGVFLSQPDGTYRFRPLPWEAQLAPVYGSVACDLDGDGRADLYLLQNSHAPVPEHGRFAGGLSQMFRGDGEGGFTAVPARESGLLVAGDGQALALADLTHNGWPDLIVSRHNSSTLAFANLGHPERASFGVRLHAAAGGPGVVGARVTVRLRDGSTQTSEVHAGGGYLSQSTLTLFFGYPADAPPTEIEVRWPDRRSTLMAWERHTPLVRINQE